eukprot:6212160-Pleurochrysis_carterae.AAC.1
MGPEKRSRARLGRETLGELGTKLQAWRLCRVSVGGLSEDGRCGVIRSPRERELVEVHVRRGHYLVRRGYPHPAAPQIHPDPCTGIHAGFGVGRSRFDGKGAATERKDTHDARLLSHKQLVGGRIRIRRSRGAVQYVHGLQSGVVPETSGGATGYERCASQFHYGSDRTFGHTVYLVDMRGGQVEVCTPFSDRNS